MCVRRPKAAGASFAKNGLPMGLTLKDDKFGDTILVIGIFDGAASASGAGLQIGDRIFAVNGKTGPVAMLLKELKDCAAASLELWRL